MNNESIKLEPCSLSNEDAVNKHKAIDMACHELDAMKAVAKILDGCPVDVAERIAAWVASKYGKPVPVTLPAPVQPTWPSPQRDEPYPPMGGTAIYGAPGLGSGLMRGYSKGWMNNGALIGSAVGDGFPVADVDDSAAGK
jgi:hypothetical protein